MMRYLQYLSRSTEFVVIGLLMLSVFMMVLPMPFWLIDILIAVNISLSAVFLILSFYIQSSVAFSVFPTILLITTLFRLAISVSTSRLALLHAFAGDIVQTFGHFVVGGNLVVGLIIFLIIAVVQFIVITKGSERVAEVSARFSLDGMPGKQMSIDGDMRAGSISADDARKRRAALEKESQFYGSMDGAMKFVKGDAISALLIVAINLVGGFLIGMIQRNMSAAEAAQTYSILAVGDGLVSQVPALLISLTSGIIVTRVSNNEEDGSKNLGQEIGMQIMARSTPFFVAAVIAIVMCAVPGMPVYVFLVLAGCFIAIAFVSRKREKALATGGGAGGRAGPGGDASRKVKTVEGVEPIIPILVEIAANLKSNADLRNVSSDIDAAKSLVVSDLGVPFPAPVVRFSDGMGESTYVIKINEVPVARGKLRAGFSIVRESSENMSVVGLDWEDDDRFLPDTATRWVRNANMDIARSAGFTILNLSHIVGRHLVYALTKHASEFLGIQESRILLTALESTHPDLVKEMQRVVSIPKITEIMQRLVSESISIRDMKTVAEALIEWGQREKESVLLTEYIRIALKRYISYRYANKEGIVPAYMFTPSVEEMVRDAIRQTSTGSYLALDPEVSKQLTANILKATGDVSTMSTRPVLLTAMDVRRYIRKMIESEAFYLSVLSFQELVPEVNVHPLGRIDL